jgi:argininosuccinate lyase
MATLWQKRAWLDARIAEFTVGRDPELDLELIPYDCAASIAHARMLKSVGILTSGEARDLERELRGIIGLWEKKKFRIKPGDEDGHTAIENFLVTQCGDAGLKIHTGRSRNDQVLTALRLYEKDELKALERLLVEFSSALDSVSGRSGLVVMPGYTHRQRAMPTTVGMWLGCFRAAADENITQVKHTFDLIDQSPLGTGAGFGVPSFDMHREQSAARMGFARVQINPMHVQLSRGKYEGIILSVCSQIMHDLNRLSSDLILFTSQEFGFVSLDPAHYTGSSIMPQKRNPDVLELTRAAYHVVLGEEFKVKSLTASLISGYNRDVQLTKGPLMWGLELTAGSLAATTAIVRGLHIDELKCSAAMSDDLYATQRAYDLVLGGMPFRAAYRRIAGEFHDKEPGDNSHS